MRTAKEILDAEDGDRSMPNLERALSTEYKILRVQRLILEVLLDIRDNLPPPPEGKMR